jgi:pyruvate-ferredoxin/flavodoxin oxidoreductase
MSTTRTFPATITMDANEAAASVAYRASEVIAIYPITPASPMGELSDTWAAAHIPNLFGTSPEVVEMQSEGGAAGVVHGALQAGSLVTTFTASQGLLLMIPNMYRIAGELTPFCMHVAARSLATHALSIFGDHSDVMACRGTGFAMLASNSVQEAHDMAAVAHCATLRARVPFLHFFDGFRTSHEIQRVEKISDDVLRELLPHDMVVAHRERALTPEHPVLRGTAQNPDTFFQAREAANPFYDGCPEIVLDAMRKLGELTGRNYDLFEYEGDPQAERVIIAMGSGCETISEVVTEACARGERVGILKVRLYRPFATEAFLAALPESTQTVAVLDRTKEPGAGGEPLFLDVTAALAEAAMVGDRQLVRTIGGRYGLGSKEFTPAMVEAVFRELGQTKPRSRFTIGIRDDVTHLSLDCPDNPNRSEETALAGDATVIGNANRPFEALFYGLGSDGTVGANKNSLKILGSQTDLFLQGYFVYDSKKAGAVTVSHLRMGASAIRRPYQIERADFIACHDFALLNRLEIFEQLRPGGTLLLNAVGEPDAIWRRLPREAQEQAILKRARIFAIDANTIASQSGLGGRISTIMQAAFFRSTALLDSETALMRMKEEAAKTYGKMGNEVIARNERAIDSAAAGLHKIIVPDTVGNNVGRPPMVPPDAPDFVQAVTAVLMAGKGDMLPVSAFPADGTWPTGTASWEKRAIAHEIPAWDPAVCTQCNLCVLICPHAAIRSKAATVEALADAPEELLHVAPRSPDLGDLQYILAIAPDDCTGCHLCVEVCPAKNKREPRLKAINMVPQQEAAEKTRGAYDFFLSLPEVDTSRFAKIDMRTSQFSQPLFEYSGACAGCGETPYIKLMTQLFGDRALIANATGCSSIYGGNLPTTPYTTNAEGRGPAWSNSLFEDNAEFGLGFRLALDHQTKAALSLLEQVASQLSPKLVSGLLESVAEKARHAQPSSQGEQRKNEKRTRLLVETLTQQLAAIDSPAARQLAALTEAFLPKSVWIVGGDGWAYDIGYGGLDHVLSLDRNINVLVLDTEVYSNTGGQQSKATPLGAAAKFASMGKSIAKKDLGMEMMSYGHVYVARVAIGARPSQTIQAFAEAESWDGPSLIIAYSHCIAHGYDLAHGAEQQKLAVNCGTWPLYRYDPRRVSKGLPPLSLDSRKPSIPLHDYMKGEARFRMVEKRDPVRYRKLMTAAEQEVKQRYSIYQQLAGLVVPVPAEDSSGQTDSDDPNGAGE